MNWYFQAIKKYADFNGRARRKEFWMFNLLIVLIVFALFIVQEVVGLAPKSGDGVLLNIYRVSIFLPSFAIGVRRMHDPDHSGWWFLLPIVNIVFAAREGTLCDNGSGPDPKATEPQIS